jgi:hypothetical protein
MGSVLILTTHHLSFFRRCDFVFLFYSKTLSTAPRLANKELKKYGRKRSWPNLRLSDFRFSRRRVLRWQPSVILRLVVSYKLTDVSEAARTSETSVNFYQNTRCDIPEGCHLNLRYYSGFCLDRLRKITKKNSEELVSRYISEPRTSRMQSRGANRSTARFSMPRVKITLM